MKSEHVEKLFSKFPWGIIFKFEHELAKWQSNNTSIINKNCKASTNASEVLCSSNQNININKDHQISHQLSNNHELKVDEVLNSTIQGALILDYYEKNNKLNDGIRSTLVDILIGCVLSKKIQMSVSLAESIANQIVAMFKSEVKVIISIDYL
jgi:hypothetical protein